MLDRLVAALRAGESQALVVRGEPGVGKTALLDYLAEKAGGCLVVRATGIQSEMELAFSGLHQLCAPVLDGVESLPGPQHEALVTTLGAGAEKAPDRFLVGLAVLSLLSEAASTRPLLGLVDDEQWLDRASAQLLAFVARRLRAESVGLVFSTRLPSRELAALPELVVGDLRAEDARVLFASAVTGPLDARLRDAIVAETRGNPLALLELPRGLTAVELAGGFGLPGALPLSDGLEDSFRRRAATLPASSRRLLLLAAAEPLGDPVLLWRAGARLGIKAGAAPPLADAGLVEFGARVRFRHPLARSAVYRSASAQERQEVHRALAEVTDPAADPDRRAWHRAQAAAGPDEAVAVDLEGAALRAQARGGVAATAAFLERAAELTTAPALRASRALAAAQAKAEAGDFDAAQTWLATAGAGPLNELGHARADLVRAQIAFGTNRGSDAPPLLLKAARRLEPVDARLARATYLDALLAAEYAGPLANPGASSLDIAQVAKSAPSATNPPGAADLLLDGLVANFVQGYEAGLPVLRQALTAFVNDVPADQELRWLQAAFTTALHIWDDDRCQSISDRFVRVARRAGAFSELPVALNARALMLVLAGDLTGAASLVDEVQAAAEATGITFAPYCALYVAAWRGDEATASAATAAILRVAEPRTEGLGMIGAELANAVLKNGLGRHRDALTSALRASPDNWQWGLSNWALVELVEAAARSGRSKLAAGAYARLAQLTRASGTDWALGVEARSHALLCAGEEAGDLYRESIVRLGRTGLRPEQARAHLLYGEWLRRKRRRGDARAQLHIAYQMLKTMGMGGFAARARQELGAAGATADEPAEAPNELTTQEAQVAKWARDGLSNPEIGDRLFISARTVQYHLGKVFTKLGITSRSQLNDVLS